MSENIDPWQKKFTPGPWVAFPTRLGSWRGYWEIYSGPVQLASVRSDQTGQQACDANARLIAAAPDLLKVCEYAIREDEMGNVIPHHLVDMAVDAVNKAYGYQPTAIEVTTVWAQEWRGG